MPKKTSSPADKASRFVAELSEYRVTSQECWRLDRTDIIKADWNESGQSPSPQVIDGLVKFITGSPLHWYPDVEATALKQALGEYTGLPTEYIQVFNGSDAALEYVSRAFLDPGDEVLMRVPTYDNFRVYAQASGGQVKTVRNPNPFQVDFEQILAALTPKTKLIYLVNPDNPTGVTYTLDQIERILKKASQAIVIIDEAYFEFYGQTAAPLTRTHNNLIVARSFSKAFALAGLRCGYLLADPKLLAVINKIRVGKSVNSLAQLAAILALKDRPYLQRYLQEVKAAKKLILQEIRALELEVIETPANFVLVLVDNPSALVASLKNDFIYIRDRSYMAGLERAVRITIGTQAQAKELLKAVNHYLEVNRFLEE